MVIFVQTVITVTILALGGIGLYKVYKWNKIETKFE